MLKFKHLSLATAFTFVFALVVAAEERKAIEKRDTKEPTTDQEFVTHALACDLCEIKVGEYVAKNAANENVRKFAERMVTDHTKSRNALIEIARDMKLSVAEGFDKAKQDRWEDIKKLKGNDFDREYMRWMVEGHEMAVKMAEQWSEKAKNEKLRDHVKKTLPDLRDHLAEARRIFNNLKS